ncbi:disease resistance protein Roq1-like [Cryptomeria japonica]|uniref:disease resistance protein Roq1-like n=1 Tax=Cryptomeria japonica TaxID=3369 RepID=UPI0027D9FB01|nr:disease resistance protein Roq1-like [Cryptomeria japonica]
MSSSSSSHHHAFSGIEPPGIRSKVSESTKIYDVFINHRGPDVKDALARQLYDSLEELGIRSFLDKEEIEIGHSFPSTIETAIRSAAVHIAIFSKGYAESPWCLAELVLMQQSQAKIIPVFYDVKPWELRYIEKGAYAGAFIEYGKKSRYQEKHKEWKEALQSISFTTGYEMNNLNDCQSIVSEVEKEVQRRRFLYVAKYPVGLDKLVVDFERRCLRELVQDFENQCGVNEGEKGKAQIVGIFGMGGIGKTTLSKELFNLKRPQYTRACFLFDVREASARCDLPSLQMKLLKDLFGEKELTFQSAEEGSSCIWNRIERSSSLSFLIVLDDIDHLEQLDALFITHMVKKPGNTLVIITTRDVGVLISAGIQVGYHLKGMDVDDARELFSWHAFSQPHPAGGFENLVDAFLGVCGGLPLSLQVLGRHVHGRNGSYWKAELEKVGTTLHRDIQRKLKISFDALDNEEKQIFLDIACFFVDRPKCIAMRVWRASGWKAESGLRKLQDKCLVEEAEDPVPVLRMHDHLRDLGREIASELRHPPRLWRPQDLKYLESKRIKNILAKTKGRCFHSIFDDSLNSRITFFLGQSDDRSRKSTSLLYLDVNLYSSHINHLRHQQQPRIPLWTSLKYVHFLRIRYGHFRKLWRDLEAPSELKELEIDETFVEEFPDFLGISTNVENKTIGGQHKPKPKLLMLNTSRRVSGSLQMIASRKSATVKPPLSFLEDLVVRRQENVIRIALNGKYCPSLRSVDLSSMKNLREVQFTRVSTLNCLQVSNCEDLQRLSVTSDLTKLEDMNISACPELEEPSVGGLSSLRRFSIEDCNFKSAPGITSFEMLLELNINRCPQIHELSLAHLNCLEKVVINSCYNLKSVTGISRLPKLVELSITLCWKLKLELCLVSLRYLKKIVVDTSVKVKSFELDGCSSLEQVQGRYDFQEIRMVNIRDCPELRELPAFLGGSRLETITINGCDKLNYLELTNCAILKRFTGDFDPEVLSILDCPMLQELPGFGHVKCLEEIRIFRCGSLQNMTFPTTLKRLELNDCRELRGMSAISVRTELVELNISDCLQLEELSIAHLSLLGKLSLANLRSVSGISHLTNLVELRIQESLEVELYLSRMSGLERIKNNSGNI